MAKSLAGEPVLVPRVRDGEQRGLVRYCEGICQAARGVEAGEDARNARGGLISRRTTERTIKQGGTFPLVRQSSLCDVHE